MPPPQIYHMVCGAHGQGYPLHANCGSSSAATAPPTCSPGLSNKGVGGQVSPFSSGVAEQAGRWGCGSRASATIGAQGTMLALRTACCVVSGLGVGSHWFSHLCWWPSYLHTNTKPPCVVQCFALPYLFSQ